MNRVKAEIDVLGRGSVWLDDQDISKKVSGLQVMCQSGQPTQVFLVMNPEMALEVEGIVTQVVDQGDVEQALAFGREQVAKYVESLAGSEIEAQALNELGWGDNQSVGHSMVDIIKHKVREYADQFGERPENS